MFPADEHPKNRIHAIEAPIATIDDDIDEAFEQFFFAVLNIKKAVNITMASITRSTSFGIIVDNDSKY